MITLDRWSRRSVLVASGSVGLSRPAFAAPFTPADVLERAHSALRHRTHYHNEAPPPAPEEDWPIGGAEDCSGFVAWCFRLTRSQPAYHDSVLFTDTLFDDARGHHVLFREVKAPAAGDIAVYPSYLDAGGKHHPGHVAILTRVRSPTIYDIIDCSESQAGCGDAVTERPGVHFEHHRAELALIRTLHPGWNAAGRGAPVFARFMRWA